MDDDGAAICVEERARARAEADARVQCVKQPKACGVHTQVGQVFGVRSLGIVLPMLATGRIEVPARRHEVRSRALAHGMAMDAMLACRHPADPCLNTYRPP